jgi:hypothetical protein
MLTTQLWQEEESYLSAPSRYLPRGSIVWIEDERSGEADRSNEICEPPYWIRGRPARLQVLVMHPILSLSSDRL